MVQFGIETYDGCDKFSAETFFLNLVLRHPKFQLSVDTQVVGFLDLLVTNMTPFMPFRVILVIV